MEDEREFTHIFDQYKKERDRLKERIRETIPRSVPFKVWSSLIMIMDESERDKITQKYPSIKDVEIPQIFDESISPFKKWIWAEEAGLVLSLFYQSKV